MSDEEVFEYVASSVAEGGWSSFMSITNNDEEEATSLAEGGWSSIYGYVSSLDAEDLRNDWDLHEEEEV